MKKTCIRKILLIVLVINFVALVIALTNFIANNPLKEYRIVLIVSFIVIAFFASKSCKGVQEEESAES
ncbi:hypothetical protein ACUNWD_00585 [Sunxiuqinia sp. A32]|uniref:hypothetical protein n=1 Tax=Sunxiuqinia sp. A32 TaxID=3461496 RepID=UPI00404581CA